MKIENHAVMFALLSKYTILSHGEDGREAIQEGMLMYGRERGKRMADRARTNGDPMELWVEQAYGEWRPDYDGQMEFGTIEREPTLRTYISKCAWCEAWQKYDLLEYGREYCVQVDAAVYEGFDPSFVCTPITTSMSWGGDRCDFDWGLPLSDEDLEKMQNKKAELGTSAMRNFTFHTAHIYYTITDFLRFRFPDDVEDIISKAASDYVDLFGQESYDEILNFPADDLL